MPKKTNLHKTLEKATYTFEVSGETIIGLHNTIAFMLNHVDKFVAEGNECSHCLKAVQAFKAYLTKILDYSGAYTVKARKPN